MGWFILWLLLAFICESIMDTIAHHKHSSWIFKLNLSDGVIVWLMSEYKDKHKYIAGYDGWHSFKGLMLLFIAGAIWSISYWYYGFIFLGMYFIVHELLYGDILLIGGRKK